jgi:hypothetical protein
VSRSARSAKRRAAVAAEEAETAPETRVAALRAPKAEPAAPLAQTPAVSMSPQAAPRATGGVSLVPLSDDERLIKLREALRARANALTTGSIAPAPAVRTPEPQSVSLDFRSGTKTTIFADGTLVTEPFDVGSLKGLAGAFPVKPSLTESATAPRPAQ